MTLVMSVLRLELEEVTIPDDPPINYAQPPEEGEIHLGWVPEEIRRIFALAQVKAYALKEMNERYDVHDDPDGEIMLLMSRMVDETDMLEEWALFELKLHFMRQVCFTGVILVRAGWQVTWSRTVGDEEEPREETTYSS